MLRAATNSPDVSQQPLVLRSLDWRVSKPASELFEVHLLVVRQCRIRHAVAREVPWFGGFTSKLVPGANLLTDVTTEYPVLQMWLEGLGDFTVPVFNRQIRDASTGIYSIGLENGVGRAGFYAPVHEPQ
jgi:hypothetical protein